jgi:hypothetical protein
MAASGPWSSATALSVETTAAFRREACGGRRLSSL